MNKLTYLIICTLLFSVTSCDKDNLQTETLEKTIPEKTTSPSVGKSMEQLLAEGYIPLKKTVVNNYDPSQQKGRLKSTKKWDYQEVTKEDLQATDINYVNLDYMKNRFTWAMGKGPRRPNGISVNNFHMGSGANASIKHGWKAYRYFTCQPIGESKTENSGWVQVPDVNPINIPNWTDEVKEHDNSADYVTIKNGKSNNWEINASSSITVGGKVGVPLVSEGSMEVTLTLGGSKGGSESHDVEENPPTGWFDVPPHKTAVLTLMMTTQTITTKYDVPIRFEGWVGADYGTKKFHGHHYWAKPASTIFYEATNGERNYKITMIERKPSTLQWFLKIIDNVHIN